MRLLNLNGGQRLEIRRNPVLSRFQRLDELPRIVFEEKITSCSVGRHDVIRSIEEGNSARQSSPSDPYHLKPKTCYRFMISRGIGVRDLEGLVDSQNSFSQLYQRTRFVLLQKAACGQDMVAVVPQQTPDHSRFKRGNCFLHFFRRSESMFRTRPAFFFQFLYHTVWWIIKPHYRRGVELCQRVVYNPCWSK